MRLFAERGFQATGVGDIEAAVGLQPRRGALYKHFPSKQALLEAALREHLRSASGGAGELGSIPAASVDREVVLALGRWFLDEMDGLRDLTLIIEHEGRRMAELTAEVKTDIVDLSYRTAARMISAAVPETRDPEAVALMILGPLVALRRTAWTFGSRPVGLDDERVLNVWADSMLVALGNVTADATGARGPRLARRAFRRGR
jgi:AcrR family transcriptional regulator